MPIFEKTFGNFMYYLLFENELFSRNIFWLWFSISQLLPYSPHLSTQPVRTISSSLFKLKIV